MQKLCLLATGYTALHFPTRAHAPPSASSRWSLLATPPLATVSGYVFKTPMLTSPQAQALSSCMTRRSNSWARGTGTAQLATHRSPSRLAPVAYSPLCASLQSAGPSTGTHTSLPLPVSSTRPKRLFQHGYHTNAQVTLSTSSRAVVNDMLDSLVPIRCFDPPTGGCEPVVHCIMFASLSCVHSDTLLSMLPPQP